MNIEDEINKILNDDSIDYSEDYADCLELMVRLRSIDEKKENSKIKRKILKKKN